MKTLIVLAITLIISESSALPHTTKPKTNKTCICVPFWQCKEDLTGLNEDGHQIINIRKSNNPSFTFEETQLNSTTDPLINPEEPPPPTEKPLCDSEFHVCCPIRCGRRNYISPDEPYTASSPLGDRILSGVSVDAEFAEFPWMLGLLDGIIYRCGATLIHPQVAVTAAHCVHSPGLYRLRAGEWNWMRDDEPNTHQDRSVTRIIIHQFYDPISLINDISLLEVDTPFTLSVNVGIVCLPPQAYSYFEATCVTSGWGKSSYSPGTYVQTLKKLDVPLVPHRVCLRQLADAQMGVFFSLHQSFMCAGGGSKDTCKGDGGSPLVCPIDGQRDRYELVGIVSWGLTCGLYDTPGVYVNVAMFSHWIDVHVIQMGYDPMVYKF